MGIVKDLKVWASNARYLNDRQEFEHGIECCRMATKTYINTMHLESNEKELGDRLLSSLHETFNDNIFVACFCEDGDLLSQWRGYGERAGGVSIGFDPQTLIGNIRLILTDSRLPVLTKVRYGIDGISYYASLLTIIRQEISKFSSDNPDPQSYYDGIVEFFREFSAFAAPIFKDNAFREENEWRIIVRDPSNTKYRATHSAIIPYIELPLKAQDQPMPLSRVIVGPHTYQGDLLKAADGFLNGHLEEP